MKDRFWESGAGAGLVVGRAGRDGGPLGWARGWGVGELGCAHRLGRAAKSFLDMINSTHVSS